MAVASTGQRRSQPQDGVWEPFQFSTGFARRHHQNRVEEHAKRGKRLHLLQLRRPGEKPQVFSVDTPINEDPSVDELVARLKRRLNMQAGHGATAAHARSISYGGELMMVLQREDPASLQRHHSLADTTTCGMAGMLQSPPTSSAGTVKAVNPTTAVQLGTSTASRPACRGQQCGSSSVPWDSSSSLNQRPPAPLPSQPHAGVPLPARARSAFMMAPPGAQHPPAAVRKAAQSLPRMVSPVSAGPRSAGSTMHRPWLGHDAPGSELSGLAEDAVLMDVNGTVLGPAVTHTAGMHRLPTESSLDTSLVPASSSISASSSPQADTMPALNAYGSHELPGNVKAGDVQGMATQAGKHNRRWNKQRHGDNIPATAEGMLSPVVSNLQPDVNTDQQQVQALPRNGVGAGQPSMWGSYEHPQQSVEACAAPSMAKTATSPATAVHSTQQAVGTRESSVHSSTGSVRVRSIPQHSKQKRWRWCTLTCCFRGGSDRERESKALETESFVTACEQ